MSGEASSFDKVDASCCPTQNCIFKATLSAQLQLLLWLFLEPLADTFRTLEGFNELVAHSR